MPKVTFAPVENTGRALMMTVSMDGAAVGEVSKEMGDTWRAGPSLARAMGREYAAHPEASLAIVRGDIEAILSPIPPWAGHPGPEPRRRGEDYGSALLRLAERGVIII